MSKPAGSRRRTSHGDCPFGLSFPNGRANAAESRAVESLAKRTCGILRAAAVGRPDDAGILLLLRTAPLPKRSFGRAIYWGEPRRLTYARVKLGHGKWLALPLPLRLVDRVANEVSTHVGWALLPVQVTDVGQEWPTDSKIDSPAANVRGSQDVTNAALQNDTTSAPGEAARCGPASACSGSNVSAVSRSRSSRQQSVVDSATDLAFGDCPAIRCSENRAGSR